MQDNESICRLLPQEKHEDKSENDIKHHLRQDRGELRVDRELVEVKVKHVLVLCRLLTFEDPQIVGALVNLMFLLFYHHDEVQLIKLLKPHEGFDDEFVRVINYEKYDHHTLHGFGILACPEAWLSIEVFFKVELLVLHALQLLRC